MDDLTLIWDDLAFKQLEARDRYTREAISEEIRRMLRQTVPGPQAPAGVEIDHDLHEYVTGVSDDRFLVVWRLDEGANQAMIKAVVPNTNLVADQSALTTQAAVDRFKEQVSRLVDVDLQNLDKP